MEQKKTKPKPMFHKLTPYKDVDISVYADAFDFVFANEDIRNVAVSGPYGAGKSSVLETYEKKNFKKKFIHISLADFKPYTASDTSSTGKTIESVLEGKILNQLLHQISSEQIPQTGFHVKKKVTDCRVWVDMLGIVTFIGLALYQLFFQKWKGFISTVDWELMNPIFKWSTANASRLLLLLVEVGLFAWGVGYAIRKQRTTGFLKKVSLQGNEFEIGQQNDESLFDKYLNEVLYLFENAGADVIVFEDLDRHESSDIFTRLREVNTLVNKHRPNKPLRFFYLLRDDIFTTKDRAKFFDFIIPIVPVLDASNAFDKFLEFFKQGCIADLFTSRFLQGLSLYIDEMRILKSVINEFQVYNLRINTTDLAPDKMLALIVYKNIFPKDFADLQLNRGFVHELLESKQAIVKEQKKQIENQIRELEKQIEEAGKSYLSDDEIDQAIECLNRWSGTKTIINKLKIAKTCYIAKVTSEQESTTEKIRKLKESLLLLERAKLCDVLSRDNIDAVFCGNRHVDGNRETTEFEEIKGSNYFDLLKFLLRNGYIDEGYADYMTYFYPESLSRNDKAFLRSIADKKARDWQYPLDDPHKVIGRLSLADFEQPETLNFDLLNALLTSGNGNEEYIKALLVQLKTGTITAFVNDYLPLTEESIRPFLEKVNAYWPEFFQAALKDETFIPEKHKLWARTTLCVSSEETIKSVNQDDCLREFIANAPDFLVGEPLSRVKLIHGMKLIGVKMKEINREECDSNLLKSVFEHNLYVLNPENIGLMLTEFYGEDHMRELGHRSYSMIMKKPGSPLAERVMASMDEYLDIVFQTCGGNIEDDPQDAIRLLNNGKVSPEHKKEYARQLSTVIEHLSDVADTAIWSDLLKNRKAAYTLENIVCYFAQHENSIDDVLTSFINGGKQQKMDIPDQTVFEDSTQRNKFFVAVVECCEIENDRYEAILKLIDLRFGDSDLPGITNAKMRILIRLEIIEMTLGALVHMRKHFPDVLMAFILTDFDTYLELIPNHLREGETRAILNRCDFGDEQKIRLLQTTRESISIEGLKCTDAVIQHVLAKNLCMDDIPFLVKRYAEFSSAIQNQIVMSLVSHVPRLVDEQIPLPLSLLDGMIQRTEVSQGNKVQLFAISLENITDDSSCQSFLNGLGLTEMAKVFNNGRPKVEDTEVNAVILDLFKKRGWIKDYTRDPANAGFLKIAKQKQSDA